VKIALICKDAALIDEAKDAYERTDELKIFSDWREALAKSNGIDLMIVDLLATLEQEHLIEGYEKFAVAKMSNPKAKSIPLVLIAAPDDYELDAMVGWPNFVFGLVRRPVTMKIFRRISTWV
jgi:hypothetical protein